MLSTPSALTPQPLAGPRGPTKALSEMSRRAATYALPLWPKLAGLSILLNAGLLRSYCNRKPYLLLSFAINFESNIFLPKWIATAGLPDQRRSTSELSHMSDDYFQRMNGICPGSLVSKPSR